jgi:hypothetical protein
MKKLILTTLFFSFALYYSHAQMIVFNGGFDSVETTPQGYLEPVWWSVQANSGGESTTDVFSGPYAMRVYNYNNTTKGILLYGNDYAPNKPGMPILVNPLALKGYYKFDLAGNDDATDSARALVWLTRYDQLNGGTDTVGTGEMLFLPNASYTAFTIPINYGADSLAADTMQIRFESSLNCNCIDTSGTCCFLYVDELTLELPNGLVELNSTTQLELNYDDLANKIWLNETPQALWHLRLVDVTGREVMRKENISGNAVDLEDRLPGGVYLYHVVVNGKSYSGKLSVR